MKTVLAIVALICATSALAGDVSNQEQLKRLYEMRTRIQSDEARANQRLGTPALAPQAIDHPTVTQMEQQLFSNLSRIENRFRCLDIDVRNEGGGITNIVCGANVGGISSDRTEAAGNIIRLGD